MHSYTESANPIPSSSDVSDSFKRSIKKPINENNKRNFNEISNEENNGNNDSLNSLEELNNFNNKDSRNNLKKNNIKKLLPSIFKGRHFESKFKYFPHSKSKINDENSSFDSFNADLSTSSFNSDDKFNTIMPIISKSGKGLGVDVNMLPPKKPPIAKADIEVLPENDIENSQMNPFMWLLTAVASFSGFLFGYDTGYISSALVVIGNDLGRDLNSEDKSFITSATALGALLGGIIAGLSTDKFGRKKVIMFANVLFIVGAIIQTAASHVWTMIIGRFVMGWGVGLASLIAPLYISELAPSRFRGRLVVLNVLAITTGQVIAYAIGAGLAHTFNGWRILVGLSMVPAVLQMIMFIFMPETPRYLIRAGKITEARKVLKMAYKGASEKDLDDKINLLKEFNLDVHDGLSGFPKLLVNLKELYLIPSNFRALFIACGLQAIQQFCGFNSLMYFSSTIFEVVGFANPTAVSLITAGTNFVFTCFAFTIIDIVGRRRILLITIWGMIAGLSVCAVAFYYLPPTDDPSRNSSPWAYVIIVSIIVYVASYAMGIGNVPWQQSELFPMSVRGLGTGMSTATNWGGNLIVAATFLTMLKNITPTGTFSFYAGLCFIGWLGVLFLYPETAGLNIEEIHSLLQGGFNVKNSLKRQKEMRMRRKKLTQSQNIEL